MTDPQPKHTGESIARPEEDVCCSVISHFLFIRIAIGTGFDHPSGHQSLMADDWRFRVSVRIEHRPSAI